MPNSTEDVTGTCVNERECTKLDFLIYMGNSVQNEKYGNARALCLSTEECENTVNGYKHENMCVDVCPEGTFIGVG